MRLWELEGGDGDDVGIGFAGGRGAAANNGANEAVPEGEEALDEIGLEIEEMDDEVEGNVDANANANAPVQLDENGQRVAVAREAPLVLRLMDNPVNNANNNNNNQGRGGHRGADNQPVRARGGGAARGRGAAHGQNHRGGQAANNARGHPANRARGARGDARRGHDGGRGGARGRAGAAGRGGAARQNPDPNDPNNQNQDGLDADQEAWVRHFVRMALLDAEDEVEGGDSDEEDENWRFR